MNEMIEKLSLQCGAWHQVYGNRSFMIDEHFDIAKFAELIVRECAEMVRKNNYQFMSNEQHYGVTSGDILNHFGVTE